MTIPQSSSSCYCCIWTLYLFQFKGFVIDGSNFLNLDPAWLFMGDDEPVQIHGMTIVPLQLSQGWAGSQDLRQKKQTT
jgi:hypothetical protein